ncbi:MAG: winged helix-turn-helix transcriptional regulator [Pseudorhodoplanes sp.]|uniref:winged helix-turn-helix transcriptional regulator n=1 Tax=Pseudorhodoplanes sp. TaxID=1934341 RepID=UPI003D1167F0
MARSPKKSDNADAFADQDEILLGVLTAIERDARTSQRSISSELGVALGLANAYLKRCVGKGWIKVSQIPPRRYAYYLTPNGFAEKTRLTAEYFSYSFTFFRKAREQMSALMAQCADNGWKRIAFAGASELAEVGTLCAHDFPIQLAGVVDEARAGSRFCGLSVAASLADLGAVDAVIVTGIPGSETIVRAMEVEVGRERVLVPALLGIASRKYDETQDAEIRAAE